MKLQRDDRLADRAPRRSPARIGAIACDRHVAEEARSLAEIADAAADRSAAVFGVDLLLDVIDGDKLQVAGRLEAADQDVFAAKAAAAHKRDSKRIAAHASSCESVGRVLFSAASTTIVVAVTQGEIRLKLKVRTIIVEGQTIVARPLARSPARSHSHSLRLVIVGCRDAARRVARAVACRQKRAKRHQQKRAHSAALHRGQECRSQSKAKPRTKTIFALVAAAAAD